MDNFVVSLSEFTYSESDSILYWCQLGTDNCKRLANFKVIIKRRYRLIASDKVSDWLGIILRGRNIQELEISLSEWNSLMQKIEKSLMNFLKS